MAVVGFQAVLMVHHHIKAEAGAVVTGMNDLAAVSGSDGRTIGSGDVDAPVEGVGTENIPGAIARGQGAPERSLEGAGGHGSGPLFGANRYHLGDRFGEHLHRVDDPLLLGAVEVSHIGVVDGPPRHTGG